MIDIVSIEYSMKLQIERSACEPATYNRSAERLSRKKRGPWRHPMSYEAFAILFKSCANDHMLIEDMNNSDDEWLEQAVLCNPKNNTIIFFEHPHGMTFGVKTDDSLHKLLTENYRVKTFAGGEITPGRSYKFTDVVNCNKSLMTYLWSDSTKHIERWLRSSLSLVLPKYMELQPLYRTGDYGTCIKTAKNSKRCSSRGVYAMGT